MFLESGTYGEVTLKQILQGKYMRRKVGGNAPSLDTDLLQGVPDLKRKIQGCDICYHVKSK